MLMISSFGQTIVNGNCPEFDQENNCMAASSETTPINVYVNLTTLPEIAKTDWFVEISRNMAYELPVIVNKDAFEGPDEEGDYSYLHMLPIDAALLDQQFLVYPNPIVNDFFVQYTGSETEDILFEIFDIQGNSIYETTFEQQPNFSKHINDLKLSKGLYFCSIRNANFQQAIKIEKL